MPSPPLPAGARLPAGGVDRPLRPRPGLGLPVPHRRGPQAPGARPGRTGSGRAHRAGRGEAAPGCCGLRVHIIYWCVILARAVCICLWACNNNEVAVHAGSKRVLFRGALTNAGTMPTSLCHPVAHLLGVAPAAPPVPRRLRRRALGCSRRGGGGGRPGRGVPQRQRGHWQRLLQVGVDTCISAVCVLRKHCSWRPRATVSWSNSSHPAPRKRGKSW